jgi:transposase
MGRLAHPGEATMAHYAGLDVSDKETAIHVVDGSGKTVWRGKRPSEPDALVMALRRHAPELERVGLETGPLAPWLYHSLKELGLPVVCLDARHARRPRPCRETRPTRMTPRRWCNWCGPAGTARRG